MTAGPFSGFDFWNGTTNPLTEFRSAVGTYSVDIYQQAVKDVIGRFKSRPRDVST